MQSNILWGVALCACVLLVMPVVTYAVCVGRRPESGTMPWNGTCVAGFAVVDVCLCVLAVACLLGMGTTHEKM